MLLRLASVLIIEVANSLHGHVNFFRFQELDVEVQVAEWLGRWSESWATWVRNRPTYHPSRPDLSAPFSLSG